MTNFAYSSAVNNLVGNVPGANVSSLVQCLNDLKTFLNSPNLDGTNIADIPESLLTLALQQKLGLNEGAQIGRGAVSISATESRTNTAYGLLTTPDRVSSVVLPANGLIAVAYQATWQQSVASAARAAIFIGTNQVVQASAANTSPQVEETNMGAVTGFDVPLASFTAGLISGTAAASGYPGDLTTGQVIGLGASAGGTYGICYVFAAAGTYDVSVQFKASSGSVTAKNRKLWVWSVGF